VNVLDYVLLALLLIFLVSGYRKGFLWQALAIVGVCVSFFVAARFHTPLAETSVFDSFRERSPSLALVVSFVGIFFILVAVTSLLTRTIGRKVKKESTRDLDKWLGALLGTAKGVILLGGIGLAFQEWGFEEGAAIPAEFQEKGEGLVRESLLVPMLTDGCFAMIDLMPTGAKQEIAEVFDTEIFTGKKTPIDESSSPDKLTASNKAADGDTILKPTGLKPTGLVAGSSTGATGTEEVVTEKKIPLLDLGSLRNVRAPQAQIPDKPVPATSKIEDVTGK